MSKDRLKNINTCAECVTEKKDCPYPGAWNSKELAHIACDEKFEQTKRLTGNHTGRREYAPFL